MIRKFWDMWGIALVAGLLTGIPLTVAGAYLGAFVTDTPVKHPLTFGWIVDEMHRSVPMWFAFIVITLAAIMTALYIRLRIAKEVASAEYERLSEELSAIQEISATSPQTFIRPDLEFLGSKVTSIRFVESHKWREEEGFNAIIVPILNKVAPIGQAGVSVQNLVASLKFENTQGRFLHHVARAYWMNYSGNQIDLDCGGTSAVVIGALEQPYEWTTYDNPNTFPVPQHLPRFGNIRIPKPPKHWIPFKDALRVTVSLITADDGTTIGAISFLLEVSENGMNVTVGNYR